MIEFTKMHGLGNDYIYINQIDGKNDIKNIPTFTRYVCNRHFGVGADGIILINKSEVADIKMDIYNTDGSKAQMCGNGIRALGKYVYENDIINNTNFCIETLAGIKNLSLKIENEEVKEITVNMGKAILIYKNEIEINAIDWKVKGIAISMGNPHFVILTKNVENIDVQKYGSFLEKYYMFPEGTNVEFIEILGNTSIKMRVWERGVGETFACGTGACASFAVCYTMGLVKPKAKVYLQGGSLEISIDKITKDIYMTGIATKVFEGKIREL